MRADTQVSWTPASFWNMSVLTPPLLYATAPAKLRKKSLYSSNGSRNTTSGRAHLNNAAHGASHSSSLPNVRGNTGPQTHLLCRDLVHGGPKSRIAVKDKPVNHPNVIQNVLVDKRLDEIVEIIKDVHNYHNRELKKFVNGSRVASDIVVDVRYDFYRNEMSNIVITVTDDAGNIYMKLCREDLECISAAGNSAPLNWIATVPLDAEKFPNVYVVVNGESAQMWDSKNEIFEIYPAANVIACLIFKNVRGSLCNNWPIVNITQARQPFLIKTFQEHEFNLFEEFLGMILVVPSQSANYKTIVDDISNMDRCVLEFQKNSDHITNAFCINASTPLLDDMTFTAQSKSRTIRGAITRQNVVDSIRFDETMPYFERRLVHEFDDAHLQKRSLVFLLAIFSAMKVRLHNLSWTSCHTWMHQEKLGGEFESNCNDIMTLRVYLCRMQLTLQPTTQEDTQACKNLILMALECMDTSLVHNIDVLCDTKDVLHGVCLPWILMKRTIFKQCSVTEKINQLLDITMKKRVAHEIDRRNTPFAQMKSPITQFVLKQILLDSMEGYLESCGLPLEFCQIHLHRNQNAKQQCRFEPGTMIIYSEDPCMCLLKAIFDVSTVLFKLKHSEIKTLPKLYTVAQLLKNRSDKMDMLLTLTSRMMEKCPEEVISIVSRLISAYILRVNAEQAIPAALTWLRTQEQ